MCTDINNCTHFTLSIPRGLMLLLKNEWHVEPQWLIIKYRDKWSTGLRCDNINARVRLTSCIYGIMLQSFGIKRGNVTTTTACHNTLHVMCIAIYHYNDMCLEHTSYCTLHSVINHFNGFLYYLHNSKGILSRFGVKCGW